MKIENIKFKLPIDQVICNLMNVYAGTPYDEIETWLRDNYKVLEGDYMPMLANPIERTKEEKAAGRNLLG